MQLHPRFKTRPATVLSTERFVGQPGVEIKRQGRSFQGPERPHVHPHRRNRHYPIEVLSRPCPPAPERPLVWLFSAPPQLPFRARLLVDPATAGFPFFSILALQT